MRIFAKWPGRKEPATSIAARLHAFLTLSKPPPDRAWHGSIPPDGFRDLQANPSQISRYVNECQADAERGEWASLPGHGCGGTLGAMSDDHVPRADDPVLFWQVGTPWTNHVQLDTDWQGKTDPRFVTYDVMRTNVLAIGTAFAADWCQTGPIDLHRYLDEEPYVRPPITLAWMVWLSPAYARVVTPPPRYEGTITEHLSDGSLFMATSTRTFDVSNLEDLRMARAIHRQIDPLNYTLPFNGQCGRSDRVPPFPKV
jgi:hypothetical protein